MTRRDALRERHRRYFFSKKRSVTRRHYYDPIGMVDKRTKKSQVEYIMRHKRGTSVGAFKDYRIDRNKYNAKSMVDHRADV